MDKVKMTNSLKNTVGYHESDNKAEYLKGAGMAIDKSVLIYEEVMGNKNRHIQRLEDELDEVREVARSIQKFLNCYGALE